MALTETYVDPSIAGNSGTGTSGDPYGDLQYALDTMTRDGTNGDRLNILAGTAEVMASAISLTTYGTPTAAAPLVFQGYTSAAADGGIGEINNGGANVSVISSTTLDYIYFVDMKLGNTGTAQIVRLDRYCGLINCEMHSSSNAIAVQFGLWAVVIRCKLHSMGATGLTVDQQARVMFSTFHGAFSTAALSITNNSTLAAFNVFDLSSGGVGINIGASYDNVTIMFCSFYASSGTGTGIKDAGSSAGLVGPIINNIFTGFSGAGGEAIDLPSRLCVMLGNNAFYNNTTNILNGAALYSLSDITLTNAPFTNAAGGDFSIASAAKTELQAQGWPSSFNGISTSQYLDPGAAQIQIPTSTGGGRRSRGRYYGT